MKVVLQSLAIHFIIGLSQYTALSSDCREGGAGGAIHFFLQITVTEKKVFLDPPL